jgi:hypothetical protein
MPRTHNKMSIEKLVARRLKAPMRKKLARCGVQVEVRRETTKGKVLKRGGPTTWRTIEHFFLVYSVLKEVGAWATIRHILEQAGLTEKEIKKLGLSRLISLVRKKMKMKMKKGKGGKKTVKNSGSRPDL